MSRAEYDEFLLRVCHDGRIEAQLLTPGDEQICQAAIVLNEDLHSFAQGYLSLLREGKLDGDAEKIQRLGEYLYRVLFPDDVDRLFEQAFTGVSTQRDRKLRVCVSVDPLSEFATWPLEFMRRPGSDGFFLATRKDLLTLSRRISLEDREPRSVPPDFPPLKVLVVVCKPPGLGEGIPIDEIPVEAIRDLLRAAFTPLDLRLFCRDRSLFRDVHDRLGPNYSLEEMVAVVVEYSQVRDLRRELLAGVREVNPRQYHRHLAQFDVGREVSDAQSILRMIPHGFPLEVKLLGGTQQFERSDGFEYLDRLATVQNVDGVARQWAPHVLHFIGHARLEGDQGHLALVNREGEEEWHNSTDLTERFVAWGLRLVVLQPCEGAIPATGPGFTNLADHIVRSNVPAVVAMQFEIRNDYASEFAKGLYESLAKGWEVDAAVQEGRWKIISTLTARWSERHFGTPVLFMLTPDGIVHPVARVAGPAKQAQSGVGLKPEPGSERGKFDKMLDMTKELVAMGEFGSAQTLLVRASEILASKQGKQGDVEMSKPDRQAGNRSAATVAGQSG